MTVYPYTIVDGVTVMIDLKVVGANIRRERKRQLFTMEQLAEKVSITDNFLGKIERGESMPSLTTLDNIACALNVSMDALVGSDAPDTEHKFLISLMEINGLTEEEKAHFIDFISTNIKYFRHDSNL